MVDSEAKGYQGQRVVGHASVAKFIASDKEHSTFIYRQYQETAARNLLYLQSELGVLELKQRELDHEDAGGDLDDHEMAMDLEVLATRALDPNDHKAQRRVKLAHEIREKLKEYQETLLRNHDILKLHKPTKQVLEAFRSDFRNKHQTEANQFPKLSGVSSDFYDDQYVDDLISLCSSSPDEDHLTQWLRNHFPRLFMRRQIHRQKMSYAASLSERRLQICVAALNIILAAAMLFGAVYNLYYVNSDKTKLGLIAAYTVVFAFCVGVLTNARRSEIFGACAAYAAVLVVFVSGNLGKVAVAYTRAMDDIYVRPQSCPELQVQPFATNSAIVITARAAFLPAQVVAQSLLESLSEYDGDSIVQWKPPGC